MYIGDFPEDFTTVTCIFTTHAATGATVAPNSAFEAADVVIFKNGSATEKTSTNGVTMTSPFNGTTGLHCVVIDTSNDTGDGGFWVAGAQYTVVLVPDETVDGLTVAKVIGTFGIALAPVFARLGAPAGASVSADIAAIEAQTDDIGAAGAGLTAIPWNAAWDAEVQSEVADALTAYDPPTNAEMEARTLVAADYATATAVDDLPTNAELATALGTADDAVLAAVATVDSNVDAIKAKTDSLTFTVAGQVDANVQYVNDVQVTGVGSEADPWGP